MFVGTCLAKNWPVTSGLQLNAPFSRKIPWTRGQRQRNHIPKNPLRLCGCTVLHKINVYLKIRTSSIFLLGFCFLTPQVVLHISLFHCSSQGFIRVGKTSLWEWGVFIVFPFFPLHLWILQVQRVFKLSPKITSASAPVQKKYFSDWIEEFTVKLKTGKE